MILLYALAVALVTGALLRGSLGRLGNVHVRWARLIVIAFAAQVILFSGPVSAQIGDLGPAAYVVSTGTVLVVVFRNFRLTGVPLIAAGRTLPEGYTNSSTSAAPAVAVLTDIFGMPAWLPAANVFSVGDVLIGLGLIVAIVAIMRGGAGASANPGASAKLPLNDPTPGTPWS